MTTTLAAPAPAVVKVDVVSPGKALVTGPGFSGNVGRDKSRFRVELTDADTVELGDPNGYIGHTPSALPVTDAYWWAGQMLGEFLNLTGFTVVVEFE